jgi:hypothetical protein
MQSMANQLTPFQNETSTIKSNKRRTIIEETIATAPFQLHAIDGQSTYTLSK